MKDELIKANDKPLAQSPNTFVQTGTKNMQIGHVDQVTANIVYMEARTQATISLPTKISFSADYYHLFVGGDVLSAHFVIPFDRALKESISDRTKEKFGDLCDEVIEEIKQFPCIFAEENHHYGKTDNEQMAYLGRIQDIKIQDNGVKIYAGYIQPIPQQRLNEIRERVAINGTNHFNEFNRTHWTIKRINLVEVLRDEGLVF